MLSPLDLERGPWPVSVHEVIGCAWRERRGEGGVRWEHGNFKASTPNPKPSIEYLALLVVKLPALRETPAETWAERV